MRRFSVIAAIVLAVAVVAVGLFVWPGHLLGGGAEPAAQPTVQASVGTGQAVPAQAADIARQLVGGSAQQQRSALDPTLAAALPQGVMFPAGAALVLDTHGWHQSGHYANSTGTVTVPGAKPSRVEIGFDNNAGSWLVTFEEQLS